MWKLQTLRQKNKQPRPLPKKQMHNNNHTPLHAIRQKGEKNMNSTQFQHLVEKVRNGEETDLPTKYYEETNTQTKHKPTPDTPTEECMDCHQPFNQWKYKTAIQPQPTGNPPKWRCNQCQKKLENKTISIQRTHRGGTRWGIRV